MKTLTQTFAIIILSIFTLAYTAKAQEETPQVVKDLANYAAQGMQKSVSPHTGYGAYGVVKSYTYNEYSKVLTIKMECYWTAKRAQLFYDFETFNVDGTLTFDVENWNFGFNSTYKNDAVRYAWSDSDVVIASSIARAIASR